MSAGLGSRFGFDSKTGELVLTDETGTEVVRHKQIERVASVNPGSYFIILEGNRVAEVSPKDPGSAPEEGCFENKAKTMSMKVIETENPLEYIRHRNIAAAQFKEFGLMDMDGMKLACAQIQSRHSYFNPLVLEYAALPEAMKLLAEDPTKLDPPDHKRKTMIVYDDGLTHWFVYHTSFEDPDRPKTIILGVMPDDNFLLKENRNILSGHNLFASNLPIQRDFESCALFALYFAQRLQGLERYLPENSNSTPPDLFKYLEESKKFELHDIKFAQLPLALALPTQTRELWAKKEDGTPAIIDTYS